MSNGHTAQFTDREEEGRERGRWGVGEKGRRGEGRKERWGVGENGKERRGEGGRGEREHERVRG